MRLLLAEVVVVIEPVRAAPGRAFAVGAVGEVAGELVGVPELGARDGCSGAEG
jgi:hypothetical protein